MDARFDAAALTNRVAHAVFGIVSAVDPQNHAVKVRIQPDDLETGWIPDAGGVQAGVLRIARPSCPGTHVVLQPVEGDGEHFIVTGVVFDTVVQPPVSPATGQVAQPGEMLVMGGCASPPMPSAQAHGSQATSSQNRNAGWWHLMADGFSAGAGNARLDLKSGAVKMVCGGVTCTLDSGGLTVSGGDVKTDSHSLNTHRHPLGSQVTGGPVG